MTGLDPRPFESLEPPPGGLELLRSRLDTLERPQRDRRLAWAVAAAGLAALLLAARLVPIVRSPDAGRAAFDRELATGSHPALVLAGLAPPLEGPVSVPAAERGNFAVQRVPVRSPNVDLYLVAGRPRAEGGAWMEGEDD